MSIFKNHKVRCSSIWQIMGNSRDGITEKQLEELEMLEKKEKLTEKQKERLQELKEKKESPPKLSQQAITYLEEEATYIETGRREEIQTKAMQKGTEQEGESIKLLNELTKNQYEKNTTFFENDYILGIPDIIHDYELIDGEESGHLRVVRDIKSCESIFTLPYYEKEVPNIKYYYQLQGYMWLTGASVAYLDYIAVNHPEWLIQKKLKAKYFEYIDKGIAEEEIEKEMQDFEMLTRFNYTYDDLPLKRRIKTFEIQRSEKVIEQIKTQIELIRKFTF